MQGGGGIGIPQAAVLPSAGFTPSAAFSWARPVCTACSWCAADQGTHAHRRVARVADGGFGRRYRNGLGGGFVQRFGTNTRRMAVHFLARFHGHFATTSFTSRSKAGEAGGFAGQQQRGIHAVGLDVDRAPSAAPRRVRADDGGGVCRACERHHIKRLQLVEQAAELPQMMDSAPAGKCPRPPRPAPCAGSAGAVAVAGLTMTGTPTAARVRPSPQAPGGEVEGIDEQRHATGGHAQYAALEQRVFCPGARHRRQGRWVTSPSASPSLA